MNLRLERSGHSCSYRDFEEHGENMQVRRFSVLYKRGPAPSASVIMILDAGCASVHATL